MNLMSSMANTLVGSVIAIVSVAPDRDSGMIWYLWQVSPGISLITPGSISNWVRLMEGTPYCLLSSAVMSSSLTKPSFTRLRPSLPPWVFWYVNTSSSCSGVMRFSLRSSSPIRTGIIRTSHGPTGPSRGARCAPATPATSRKNPPGTATLTPPVADVTRRTGRARVQRRRAPPRGARQSIVRPRRQSRASVPATSSSRVRSASAATTHA